MASFQDAAVAGVFMTKQGDLSDVTQQDVWFDSVEGALADAGLTLDDVDGLIGGGPEGVGIRNAEPGAGLADLLGHPLRFQAAATIGASSQGAGICLATMAVAHGLAECVIIPTAAGGVAEGYGSADRDSAVRQMAQLGGPYEYVWGTTRVADYAQVQRRHMYEYGTTREQLAEIAVAQRYGATLHPNSAMGYRGEITIADVINSRVVADPIHLLDCCVINQGGGCVVVTRTRDVKATGRHPAISLLGYGEAHHWLDHMASPSMTSLSGNLAADTAFGQAEISQDDVDVASISDHFSIGVIIELEDAGFCTKGEGGAFVENQATRIGGRLPINTSGGFLSGSHAGQCGLFGIIELVTQLRGEAGPRQVHDAEIGYSCGVGGVMHTKYSAILGKV